MYKQHALMTEKYFTKLNKSAALRESIGDFVMVEGESECIAEGTELCFFVFSLLFVQRTEAD